MRAKQADGAEDGGRDLARRDGIYGSGEMATLIRAHDWSRSSLGPIGSWSETLQGAVSMMLSAQIPMQLFWGAELIALYNDAMKPALAEKHPHSLGQPGQGVWEEAWPVIGGQLLNVLERGEAVHFHGVAVPILKNGVIEDQYWDYSYSPIYEPDGRIGGVLDVAYEVTETIRAQRQVGALAEQMSQMMESTSDAVVGVDRRWVMTYVNPKARELYRASGELLGRTVWEAFPEAAQEDSPFLEPLRRAMDERISGSFEAYYAEPLNLWLGVEMCPTRDGIVTFSRDITEKKKTVEALLQTEKLAAVGRMAASIAHEINNPLESVTNLLYLARRTEDLDELQEYLEIAERELRRVSVITNQTLRFYKQSSHSTEVTCEDLFDTVLLIYQGRIVNSRVQVQKRKRAQRPIDCFDGEIRQVLNNLVGNAIDAMHPAGGRLLVRSRESTSWATGERGLTLTVADTGHGMHPHVVRKIFEAFYTTKGIGGTGLGLWVSREIVDRHKGTLRVRTCQEEGRSGTVFALFLPFVAVSRS